MRKSFVLGLLIALVVCGCQTKEMDVCVSESKPFIATIDDECYGDTKTSMNEKGNVLWKKGDQISIFAGSSINEKYQVTDASDGKTAAELEKVSGSSFVAGGEIDTNVAYYPYSSANEIEKDEAGYVLSGIALPSVQYYAENSFGNGSFPMAAVTSSTDDMNLKFKNVLGGLKLQLQGTATIKSISITGNNNDILCGSGQVAVSSSTAPVVTLTDAAAKTVILDCGEGVQLNADAATSFVVALPPMTMANGFTVTVKDAEGKQMEIKTTKSQTITRSNLLKMPAVNYEGIVVEPDYTKEPFTITSFGSTTVKIAKIGSPDNIYLQYRIGANDWASYNIGSAISLNNRESVQFRASFGNSTFSSDAYSSYYQVAVNGDGTIAVSGNIVSLLDASLQKESFNYVRFGRLFYNCHALVDASNLHLLPTSNTNNCYDSLFENCINLTAAPSLPATTLAACCYCDMFNGCSSLTEAPDLPATTLAIGCYQTMFANCSQLTKAPKLESTVLADGCYQSMFYGCSSLTTAPELPATTLAPHCYDSMFDASGLTTAPDLPANILADYCYAYMFAGCTGLSAAPELLATTLVTNCYECMFSGCKSLNYIKMMATDISATLCLNWWVNNVASTGTFVKNKTATWDISGKSGIPEGWTVVTDGENEGPEIVDLGLSVNWASCNIGANKPEEYGHYFSWGNTTGYAPAEPDKLEQVTINNCDWIVASGYEGTGTLLANGFTSANYELTSGRSLTENIPFSATYDAAIANWGGSWRMPSQAEFEELLGQTVSYVTNYNNSGVNGLLITGKKTGYTDKSIFLPATGSVDGKGLGYWNDMGYYWTSTISDRYFLDGFVTLFNNNVKYTSDVSRYYGFTIRPVSVK